MGLCLAIVLIALIYVLPSIPGVAGSPLARFLPSKTISLGLDLKGGIHLTLGVDMKKALEASLDRMGEDLKATAREKEINVLRGQGPGTEKILITLLKASQQVEFEKLAEKNFKGMLQVESKQGKGGDRVEYVFAMTPKYREDLERLTIDQALKTIRNRIDQFGVAEPDIRRQEGGRIQVQLPGLSDPERAIQVIGQTAHLEFKMVDDEADPAKAAQGIVPPGDEVTVLRTKNQDGSYTERPIVLKKNVALTGDYISDAQTHFDSYNQAYVALTFNPRGAMIFERVTGENIKKRMAIVLDGKVYSAPVIQDKIAGGRASITGRFTVEEARDLAIVLRAGALPAPVTVMEQRTVGPSLGQESIDSGLRAALLGGALVVAFMVLFYSATGLVADLALVVNMVLIMGGLAMFGATLTLPGIAGIILVIGMAVDSNVIINERIREELRRGLTAKAAIAEGYSRAMLAILDANITNVIAGTVMYEFGTGPVRGFAVTLIMGILCSMFTAVFMSRIVLDAYMSNRPADAKLSI
jgi:preprotein translocase subunit SecD